MDRLPSHRPIVRATYRLAVDSHNLAFEDFTDRLHPVDKAALELLAVQSRENPAKGIV
jgi:hypothetical protein